MPLHYRYTYDALGNISTVTTVNPDNTNAEVVTYTYDNQSQLTKAVSSVNGTWNYQYDTYGNLRNQTHGSDTVNYTYGNSNWKDLLTAVSGSKSGVPFSGNYTYDGAGNPTGYYNIGPGSSWTMTWKNGRELASASDGTHTVSYDYDVNGLRTWKIVDGVRHDYIYASGKLLRETFTQGDVAYKLDFFYDQNGRPYMLYRTKTEGNGTPTTKIFYYLLNLQGDVIKLVDRYGSVCASYTYDAWGNILTSSYSMANLNPLRYRGYYYDSETGFYYLQSRYYDPALGRFLNADSYASTGQGFLGYNMFAYCNNEPERHADYSGCDAIVLLDSDSFTHVGLLIQGKDGKWYHFYWGSGNRSLFGLSSTSSSSSGSVRTYCELIEINNPMDLSEINQLSSFSPHDYEQYEYFTGDYSACLEYAQNAIEYYGEYNLYNNNCSQVSFKILGKANDKTYKALFSIAEKEIVPKYAFNTIAKGGWTRTFYDAFLHYRPQRGPNRQEVK